MIKIIEYIFILFLGISVIVIAFLFRGFEIDNFTYENINIQKLYLKYDKKLNISTENFRVYNKAKTAFVNMGISFSVEYIDSLLEFNVTDFHIDQTDVKIKSLVHLDLNLINFEEDSKLHLKDFNIVFDKKLDPVTAKDVTLSYKNKTIYSTINKPYYSGVSIEGSKVSYSIDKNTLDIIIKTKSLLNKKLKKILLHYGVKINTIQHNGNNEITTQILIPFDKGGVIVNADVIVKNSTIEDFGQKYKVNKSTLHFKGSTIKGAVDLDHYDFQDFHITNSLFNYTIDLKKKRDIKVTSKTINIKRDNNTFYLHNANFYINDKHIDTNLNLNDDTSSIFAKLTNKINLKTKTFVGKIDVHYQNPGFDLLITSKNIPYNGSFGDNFVLNIANASAKMEKPEDLKIEKLSVNVLNEIVKTDFILKDDNENIKVDMLNTTDLNLDTSIGNLDILNLKYKDILSVKNKNIAYDLSFKNGIMIHVPLLGLEYTKDKNMNHEVFISKPHNLLNSLSFLETKDNQEGFIKISATEGLESTEAHVENINLNIDSTYFAKQNTNDKIKKIVLPKFPKIQLSYLNSNISYDDFTFLFDKLSLKTDENILNLKIKHQDSQINLLTENNSIQLNGTKLTDKYINILLNKEIFKDGFMNVNIYGEDINFLSGDINFHQTTVKNVAVINSLLTFINTTPAIINPLLALPTLFRLSQTGFDTNGYYMKNGDTSFRYNVPNQQLDIYDLYTNGYMSNFVVNSHLDFMTKKINANIDISFFKDFTTTLNYIPIFGYIIMGDDGEFHTSVDITGTYDDPILETHTIKEAAQGVTGIIKRILTLPIQPFLPDNKKNK